MLLRPRLDKLCRFPFCLELLSLTREHALVTSTFAIQQLHDLNTDEQQHLPFVIDHLGSTFCHKCFWAPQLEAACRYVLMVMRWDWRQTFVFSPSSGKHNCLNV